MHQLLYENEATKDGGFEEEVEETSCFNQGRNRHTMRRYPWRCQKVTMISRTSKRNNAYTREENNGHKEFAVTEIDEYFDPNFIVKDVDRRYQSSDWRPLNTKDQWECVIDKLEALSVKKTKEYGQYDNTVTIHYDLPVQGHIVMNNYDRQAEAYLLGYHNSGSNKQESRTASMKPTNWLFWNGKFHDPAYIYEYIPGPNPTINAGTLKQLCPIAAHHNPYAYHARQHQNLSDKDSKHHEDQEKLYGKEIGNGSLIDRANTHGHYYRDNQSPNRKTVNYLEIDLKQVCDIRAIITQGGYPRQLETFPTSKRNSTNRCSARIANVNCRRSHFGTRRRRRGRQPFVYVVKDRQSLAWVKTFTIHYRDVQSGKWHAYGEPEYTGNEDVNTDKITEVSIRARYIRVTPVQYHHFREMRVTVLGSKLSTHELGGVSNDRDRDVALVEAEAVETIRYTIHPPHSTMRHDGYVRSYRDKYGVESKHKKKNRFKSDVQEQLQTWNNNE
jgi:hypothetical protein